jgi:signal peptidase I
MDNQELNTSEYTLDEDLEQEELGLDTNDQKLLKRAVLSVLYTIVIFLTMLSKRYHDFDVVFKVFYNRNNTDFYLMDNIGSILFIGAFIVSILYTGFIFIYLWKKQRGQVMVSSKRLFEVYDVVSIVPLFIVIVTVLNAFVISPASVTRTSMEPNYHEGDNVFLYHTENVERFDVVIVKAQDSVYDQETGLYTPAEYYIKRVIGLPGEVVTIKNGQVYIDGELLDDPTVLLPGAGTYCSVGYSEDVDEECSFVIDDDSYFLMGDNREGSYDSRDLGPFDGERVYGVVLFKIG